MVRTASPIEWIPAPEECEAWTNNYLVVKSRILAV